MTYSSFWFRLAVVVGALLVPGCAQTVDPNTYAYCRNGALLVPEEPDYNAYEACMAAPEAVGWEMPIVDPTTHTQYEYFQWLQSEPLAPRLIFSHV